MEVTIKLTTEQIINSIQQMPGEDKLAVVLALAKESMPHRVERMQYLETKVRDVCTKRGLNWDTMTDEDRQDFINDIVHEDCECTPIVVYDTNV